MEKYKSGFTKYKYGTGHGNGYEVKVGHTTVKYCRKKRYKTIMHSTNSGDYSKYSCRTSIYLW